MDDPVQGVADTQWYIMPLALHALRTKRSCSNESCSLTSDDAVIHGRSIGILASVGISPDDNLGNEKLKVDPTLISDLIQIRPCK